MYQTSGAFYVISWGFRIGDLRGQCGWAIVCLAENPLLRTRCKLAASPQFPLKLVRKLAICASDEFRYGA